MKRVPVIDFIRFASIFVVIGDHFYPRWVASFAHSVFLHQLILTVFLNGAYGVICFFVVSGFLITRLLIENTDDFSRIDLKSFYVKRAARIIPLWLVVILTGFFMNHAIGLLNEQVQKYDVWSEPTEFGWLFWVSLFSFNFNWYLIDKHVGMGVHWNVFWSLAVEEQFYLCYPLIAKFLGNRQRVLTFLWIIVISGVVFRVWALPTFETNGFFMHQASWGAFDQIAVGAILYFADKKWGGWFSGQGKIACLLMFLGMSGCFYFFAETSFENGVQFVVVPTLLAISCALTILGGLYVPLFNSKATQFLSWPGKFSYGCYLWHPTLIVLLMPVLVSLGGLWGLIYLVLAVFFFAFLFYRYFEVPVNHQIRAWFNLKPSLSE